MISFAAGDDEHFGFVIKTLNAFGAKELGNQLSIQHAKPALRVRDRLPAKTADRPAHVTIHNAPNEWHSGEVVHAITEEKAWSHRSGSRREKPIDFFGKMLAVGIENDHTSELPI